MANHKSALKRARQSESLHESNKAEKSRMRTFTKKVMTAVAAGDESAAQLALREASSVMAVTARKGVIHKNQAARRVKRLHAKVKGMAMAPAAAVA